MVELDAQAPMSVVGAAMHLLQSTGCGACSPSVKPAGAVEATVAAQQAAAPVANVPWLPSHPDADPAVLTRSMLEKLPPEKVQQVLQDYRGASTNILRLRNREPRHSIAVQSADGGLLSDGYSVVPDTASDITLASLSAARKTGLTISATRTKLNTGTGQGGTLGQLVGGLPTVFAPGTP